MQKSIQSVIVFLFVCLATSMSAQVYAGFRGGLSRARVVIENDPFVDKTEPSVGITVGGGVETVLSGPVSAQLDAMITQKGGVLRDASNGKNEWSITNIDIPLAIKGNFEIDDKQGLFLGGGLGVGYALGGNVTLDNGQTGDFDFGEAEYDRVESFYFGTVGFYSKTPSGKMMVDIRYQRSMANQYNGDSTNIDIKNNQLLITVAYYFQLAK